METSSEEDMSPTGRALSETLRFYLMLPRLYVWLSGALYALGGGLGVNGLTAHEPRFVVLGVAFATAAVWTQVQRDRLFRARFCAPPRINPLISDSDTRQEARRGLVVLVSKWTYFAPKVREGETPPPERPRDWPKSGRDGDWEVLQLHTERTNMRPAIHAVKASKGRLEHIWYISTSDIKNADGNKLFDGSVHVIPALNRYLREECGVRAAVHAKGYVLDGNRGPKLCRDTYDAVQRAFDEAETLGIAESEMLVDLTGGLTLMTLGALLACLDSDREVQAQHTNYDAEASPVGPLTPVRVEFEVTDSSAAS